LDVQKTFTPQLVEPGGTVQITVTVTNIGTSEAYGLVLQDILGDLEGSPEPVEIKLIQPGKIDTEIWIPPEGELAGIPGPSASAEECALGIAEALETDGFEFMVPADLRDHVAMKNADLDGWIELMAAIGRDKLSGTP